MKKVLWVALMSFHLGQSALRASWSIEALPSLNMSFGSAESARNLDKQGSPRWGAGLYLGLDKALTDSPLHFQTGMALMQKGVKSLLLSLGSQSVVSTISLDYLEWSGFVKLQTPSGISKLQLMAFTGPVLGLALNRTYKTLGVLTFDLDNRFKSYDVAWVVGVGAQYQLASDLKLITQLRFSMGFVDLDTQADSYFSRALILLAGIALPL